MVANMLKGEGSDLGLKVNGSVYHSYYFLANGIYLSWFHFVQTIREPQNEKRWHFAKIKKRM
jgi:hypothetical protein